MWLANEKYNVQLEIYAEYVDDKHILYLKNKK